MLVVHVVIPLCELLAAVESQVAVRPLFDVPGPAPLTLARGRTPVHIARTPVIAVARDDDLTLDHPGRRLHGCHVFPHNFTSCLPGTARFRVALRSARRPRSRWLRSLDRKPIHAVKPFRRKQPARSPRPTADPSRPRPRKPPSAPSSSPGSTSRAPGPGGTRPPRPGTNGSEGSPSGFGRPASTSS